MFDENGAAERRSIKEGRSRGRETYYTLKEQQEEQTKLKPVTQLPSALQKSSSTPCQEESRCNIMGGSLSKSRRKMRKSKARKSKRNNTMIKK